MQIPSTVYVTEQPIDVSNLTNEQLQYYRNLAKEISTEYKKKQGRQIFTLSGPPGSGKSVVGVILEYLFKEGDSLFQFLNVGIDAFHYDKAELEERKLLDVKGRYDTYDTELLHDKLSQFKAKESVLFPVYSREEHNPIQDRLPTNNENILLFLEGQWLLRDTAEWNKIRSLSSLNYGITASVEDMRENIIERHMAGGRSEANAKKQYEENDLKNTKEVQKKSVKPDKEILFYKDI